MADLATLQTRLTEAEAALHALQTGARIVDVWNNGKRLKYTGAQQSVEALRAYIAELGAQIAALTGVDSTDPRLNRFAGRFFYR